MALTKLVATEPGQLRWQDYEEPPLSGEQVRVRSEHGAAKHGTELAFFKGYAQPRGDFDGELKLFRYNADDAKPGQPLSPGNMIVGEIIEVGRDAQHLTVGQRVCCFGAFQSTVVARAAACRVMPEGMDWRAAVCLDPAVFAMGAVRDGHVRVGDAVAVFGLGAIGLMVVQLLKLAGADPIIAVDPVAKRREVALAVGATTALDTTACDAGLEIKRHTANRGADVVIEYSGNVRAMQAALRGVAFGGNVVAGAFPPPYPAGLDLGAEAHMNIPNIIFSRACSRPDRDHPRWNEARIADTCWRLLCGGALRGDAIVQPVIHFDQLKEAYGRIASHPDEYLKLGVNF